jgi:membrane associated rhomboid family serine protease
MAGAPDLFVVCKNCGSEVSPYITECPYCGNRLRKRAPKIERDASGESRPKERRKAPKRSLPKLKSNEIPGLRGDEDRRPYVTIALVALGAIGFLVLAFVGRGDIALVGPPGDQVWRIFTTPFVEVGAWSQLATLLCVAIFGALLERRHGPFLVLFVWLLAASGGAALVAGLDSFPVVLGANAGALGLLAAWVVPVLLARRARPDEDDDADLLGVLVIGVVVAALPIASPFTSALAGAWGAVAGALVGLVLARARPR